MNIRPAIIIIQDNKLLTLQYYYSNEKVNALPGGNLEVGEYLETALKREMEEELGMEIETQGWAFIAEAFRNNKNTIHFIFNASIIKGIPIINPEETSANAIEWVDLNEIANTNIYPNVKQNIIDNFLKKCSDDLFLGPIEQKWY